MGYKDTVSKIYLSDVRRFADLFNFYLYEGKPIIKPEQLRELDPTEIALPYGKMNKGEPVQKMRDLIRAVCAMTDDRYTYLLLAIEEQSSVHYAMPTKNMLYDALQYAEQVEAKAKEHRSNKDKTENNGEFLSGFYKSDKIIPVITLTVYFGADDWDAPRSLHEMMQIEDKNLLRFIPDYKLNLIVPAEIGSEGYARFVTDLKEIFEFIESTKDRKKAVKLLSDHERFGNMPRDAAEMISVFGGFDVDFNERKEPVNMSTFAEEWKKDLLAEGEAKGRAEGEAKGRAEGEAKGRAEGEANMVKRLFDLGNTAKQIAAMFKIPETKVEEYLAMKA